MTTRRQPPASLRLFIAIDLPDEVRDYMRSLQDELRPVAPPLRWVRPEGTHLTLRFLGSVPADVVPQLEAALDENITGLSGFQLHTAQLGTFGGRRARVLWLGIDGDLAALGELKAKLDDAVAHAGLGEREEGRLTPHLTLARVPDHVGGEARRRVAELAEGKTTEPQSFEVRSVALMRSHLRPSGARYETLAMFGLTFD